MITDRLLAKEIALTDSGTIYLHRHVNASLVSNAIPVRSLGASRASSSPKNSPAAVSGLNSRFAGQRKHL